MEGIGRKSGAFIFLKTIDLSPALRDSGQNKTIEP